MVFNNTFIQYANMHHQILAIKYIYPNLLFVKKLKQIAICLDVTLPASPIWEFICLT